MSKIIVKATGEREEFDPQKLKGSLLRSGTDEGTADSIVSRIENELKEGDSTKDIYTKAFKLLDEERKPAAFKYSLRHAIMDLGPTGFPFEQFVAEIFKAKGFETTTEFIAKGDCAEHEIDVTAWNNEKLIFVEAKFHNQLGIKSDLKVALYIKARWDDLKDKEFAIEEIQPNSASQNFVGKRKMDEGWLITNTKFSESAINYAKCRNMKIIGWNYPHQGNLQDLIEESGLHPITCLTSINPSDEKLLMERGIVLCKQAKENLDIVRQTGLSEEKIRGMMEEINMIQK